MTDGSLQSTSSSGRQPESSECRSAEAAGIRSPRESRKPNNMNDLSSSTTVLIILSSASVGLLVATLASRMHYGGKVRALKAQLASSRASKAQADELLVQARRQAEFHQEELRVARRAATRTERPPVEKPKVSVDLPDVFIGLPSHGFQETQPFSAH